MDPQAQAPKRVCTQCGRGFTEEISWCPDDGSLLVSIEKDQLSGTLFADRYQVLSVLGQGGMGKVYKARHQLLDRLVAIKMVHPDLIQNHEHLRRFQQEARAASSLSHPNIITVYDFGITPKGLPYLIMDYLDGACLSDLIEGLGHLELTRSINIFMQASSALAHAHKRGVIHRDLKPSNIMLVVSDDEADVVKLVDFGIAKLLPRPDRMVTRLTQTGEVFGSPLYMSPEQCMGQALDARSDIYSLGCLMYETLSGIAPLSGETVLATIYKHVNEMPLSFGAVNPDIYLPLELESIVFKALAKDPAERHQSMEELKTELAQIVGGGAQALRTASAGDRPPAGEPGEGSSPSFKDFFEKLMLQSDIRKGGTDSERELLDSLASEQEQHGRDDPHLLEILNKLIRFYQDDERHLEAIPYCDRVIEIVSQHSGPESFDLALARVSKADVCYWLGRYADAEPLYKEALRVMERTLGGNHHDLIWPLGSLASVCEHQGNARDAELLLLRAVDIAENAFGPEHADVASPLESLALFYYFQGSCPKAEELFRRILTIKQSASGEKHESVARTLVDLANCLRDEARYQQAEDFCNQAIHMLEQLFGPDHPKVADVLSDLGYICEKQDRPDEAKSTYLKALKIKETYFSPEHIELASTLQCLGSLSLWTDDLNDAESYYTRALEIKQRSLGKRHPDLSVVISGLGLAKKWCGKTDEAESLFKLAIEISEETLGQWHSDLIHPLECLGDLYEQEGRYPDAESAGKRALSIKERRLGPDHYQLLSLIEQLSRLCKIQGKTAESEHYDARAERIRQSQSDD